VVVETRLGSLALAHNGNLVNTQELREKLLSRKCEFVSTTDSEAIAVAIGYEVDKGKDWLEAAISAFAICQGAFSLTIATPKGVMGVRDPHGVRPLVIGTLGTNPVRYVLASETCGLDIIGAEFLRDVEPGELVWITEAGMASFHWSQQQKRKLCIFEMIYFARPDSMMEGESLYSYRQAMRESGIRMKLNPLRDVLEGKRVIIIDDSIVRGTTSRKIVKALRDAGATAVHMRISSPPVTHPCFYGIDTDNQDQLIAATKSVAEIAAQIEVDSLAFLSWEGMLMATNEDPKSFCSACFTGDYPIEVPELVKRAKLILEKAAT